MLRVPIHKIQPGMVLARPVAMPNDSRRFLLQRDREIPLDMIPRLKQLGVYEVWVRHRDLEFLEDVIDEGLSDHQREVYQHVRRNFESMMDAPAAELDIGQFQNSISGLFDFLKQSSCGNMLLQKLDSFDNYLMSHSTNVCYLALLLGMKLERYLIEERVFKKRSRRQGSATAGLGLLAARRGQNAHSARGREQARQAHAGGDEFDAHAPDLRPRDGQGPRASLRRPGRAESSPAVGWPRLSGRVDPVTGEELPPLAGRQIPIFSRIATVCDVYDAATAAALLFAGQAAGAGDS